MSTQLTLSEAAKTLNVSEKSIRRYIKSGRMRANLIKGQKGYEYRIDKNQLKVLEKPPRGKNSHQATNKKIRKLETKKLKKTEIKKLKKTPKPIVKKTIKKKPANIPLESIGEILKKKKIGSEENIFQRREGDIIDYKTLYENLLVKYEQTLIMLGALETQVLNRSNPVNNAKMEKMEDSIAKQEEIIMDLYQTIQLYKNEHNY
jgi:excisionase family DNA binding protein